MELQQLKVFLSVARHGCFSTAAKKTLRTQPAVSLQVKALEEELGVKLFDRISSRNVVLTEEGKILQGLLAPILDDLESLPARFREACGKTGGGQVRIATHASVMTYLLPGVIKAFKKKFPECRLSIVSRDKGGILSMVKDGEADLGIASLTEAPKELDYRVFAKFKRIVIAARGHPLSKKASADLRELAKYPLIVAPKGSATRAAIDRAFAGRGIEYGVAMEVTGRDAVKEYVGMGIGVSIINEYYLTDVDRKRFFVKDASALFGSAERGVISRKGKYISAPARGFIDILCRFS